MSRLHTWVAFFVFGLACLGLQACATPPSLPSTAHTAPQPDPSPHDAAQLAFQQGTLYLQQGRFEDATHALTQAITLDPNLRDAYHNRGIAWMKQNKFYRALNDFSAALDMGEEDPELYFNLGNAYAQRSLFTLAVKSFKRAVELKPDHVGASTNLASAYTALGQLDDAIHILEIALQKHTHDPHAFNVLAVALERTQHPLRAEACYRHAILVDPTHAPTYYNLASLLSGQKRTYDALQNYDLLLSLTPKHTALHTKITSRTSRMRSSNPSQTPPPTLPPCLPIPAQEETHAQRSRP